jgi:uncharacterized membrane protein YhhN
MGVMTWATAICLFGLGFLLRGEIHHDLGEKIVGKVAASIGFFLVGAMAMPSNRFGYSMVLALGFGVLGDIALLSARGFLAGLVAFLIGHLGYVIGFGFVVSIDQWPCVLALIPIGAALIALRWLWPHLGAMRIPVIAYVTVISLMVVGSIAVWRADAIEHPARMLAGTILFFASDLTVARDKFVVPSIQNRIVGLPLYYAAQLLIAWSLS